MGVAKKFLVNHTRAWSAVGGLIREVNNRGLSRGYTHRSSTAQRVANYLRSNGLIVGVRLKKNHLEIQPGQTTFTVYKRSRYTSVVTR